MLHPVRGVCRTLAVMDEDTRSADDPDERPEILPPEEPNADGDPPWSHAQADRAVVAGDDGKPYTATGALIGLGVGVVVLLAAVGLIVSMLVGGDAKKPGRKSTPHAAPTSPGFPTTKPTLPTPTPPHQAVELPKFPGEPSRQRGRINDHQAGLSYARLSRPWRDGVPFTASGFDQGQYYVTEQYPGGTWQATIMSGQMAAKQPEYVGTYRWFRASVAQAASVAGKYYPNDHRTIDVASQPVKVSGRNGWLVARRLYFHEQGLKATNELMVIVAVDTGHDDPGVLYVSIPNTENAHLPDVNALVSSLKVIK